jgi:hypothetical protein
LYNYKDDGRRRDSAQDNGPHRAIASARGYHYTSAQALLSSVQSQRIWASHVRYLNDTAEATWMWRAVLRRLRDRRDSAKTEQEISAMSELVGLIERRQVLNEFVASFSENGDDLTQWRAYCPAGNGFSIGFSSAALRLEQANGWQLLDRKLGL